MNIAFMVGLAFGVAAAANFPVLILSMYWKGLTTRGALWGGYGGVISAVLFVVFSKSVWVDVLQQGAAVPLHAAGAVRDADRLLPGLRLLGLGQQRPGSQGT
jgi:Na+(H+)/acetate symporter ActP